MPEGNCSPSANESRALVVLEPASDAPHPHRVVHPQAQFLAHLIACAEHVPQLCEKRRAAPQEAEAAYQDVIKRLRM